MNANNNTILYFTGTTYGNEEQTCKIITMINSHLN